MGRKVVSASDAPKAIGPYSQAIEAGGFVFLSGQIPIDHKTGGVLAAPIADQTRLVLDNAKAILTAAGCTLTKVVKVTIYLKNMMDFTTVNDIYGQYFVTEPPARSTVEVARLPKDVVIEMDFIAWKG